MCGNRDYRTGDINIKTCNASGSGDDWYINTKYTYTKAKQYTNSYYSEIISTVNAPILWNDYTTATISDTWIIPKYYDTTTCDSDWGTYHVWKAPVVLPGERIRQMIQARMAPVFHRRRSHLSIAADVREYRARQTLRRILGEQAFKKFIRNGFITVVPKSGLTYRIFPGHGMTEVYDRGIMVDRLCVVLQGDFPPTDSLLMRYLLILNDEGEFSKYAIKHYVSPHRPKLVFPAPTKVESLTKVWAKLQVA